ncbi:MAG TPA: hypothetical protein PK657_10190 [Legionella sp.]|nr:hypothetical protein [Legionella sp.]
MIKSLSNNKETRYKYQKEVRALWEPKEKLIHNPFLDVVIPVKCTKRYCEIFDEL